MRIRVSELWRLDGTIDRGPYFAIGAGLMTFKVGLDYLLATRVFHREWSPFAYATPSHFVGMLAVPLEERFFYRAMLLVALPFLACGIALTLRRLRSAGLPLYPVVLF